MISTQELVCGKNKMQMFQLNIPGTGHSLPALPAQEKVAQNQLKKSWQLCETTWLLNQSICTPSTLVLDSPISQNSLFLFKITFSDWLVHQHRDSISSYVGHHSILGYFALAENESIGRYKYRMLSVNYLPINIVIENGTTLWTSTTNRRGF